MRRGVILAAGAMLLTAACAESAPEREAGLFYNELRLCMQNQTSENVEERVQYGNDGTLVNDAGKQQDEFSTLLGPQAFVCYTTKAKVSYPAIYFQLKSGSEWSDVVQVSSSNTGFSVRVDPDNSAASLFFGRYDKESVQAEGGKSFTFTLEDLPNSTIVGYISGQLRTYPNGTKAYQMDLRIIPN
jgi:hypothetical protein